MMKRGIVSALLVGGMVTSLSAGGDLGGVVPIELETEMNVVVEPPVVAPPKEEPKVEVVKEKAPESNYYMVVKGLSIAGDDLNHEESDKGLGVGIDLGYKLGGGFATELGLSYAKNKLNNAAEDDASYQTASLSLVYDFELTENFGLFAKGGYMYEKEKVSALNIDNSDNGLVYGGGLSYKINDGMSLIGEYETSKIDSLRGDALGVGLKIDF